MQKILVLGAGMVAGPLVRHLLDRGHALTVTSLELDDAVRLIGGHPAGEPLTFDLADEAALGGLVAGHDLVVSLVPYSFHPLVGRHCLEHGKHLITASYVSPEMEALDAAARGKGLVFLNEIGLDPGIDHMSAMRIVDEVQGRGGTVASFRSYCGGLPAPEANDNPFGYKFSWAPRGVLLASRNGATYLRDGRVVETAPERLFRDMHLLSVPGAGDFEAYANRDSLMYRGIYGLGEGLRTLFRGTLRNMGWCDTMFHLRALGLLDLEERAAAGQTIGEYVRGLLGAGPDDDLPTVAAARMGLSPDCLPPRNLAWLGLFGDRPVGRDHVSPLDAVGDVMLEKLAYADGERDMVVMHHEFQAFFGGAPDETITSTLVAHGVPGGDSAMARTVSLPAAVAADMILDGRIARQGVLRPVHADIYEPILDELANLDIVCREATTTH
jgi:saccharopine dehydrogenase-like NADP-dependent oxidoreductase